jgi:hypothetical protein
MDYLTNYYKNLSEQLQKRVNHLQQMLNEAYPGGMTPGRREVINRARSKAFDEVRKSGQSPYKNPPTELRARGLFARAEAADQRGYDREISAPVAKLDRKAAHESIVDEIVTHHVKPFPHLTSGPGSQVPDPKRSESHVRQLLDNHPSAPFTSVAKAVDAIAPHAIQANNALEMASYDDAMERSRGADPFESDWYEDHVMEREAEHQADLIHNIGQALKAKHG